ncbi:MAG TPA: biotin/lipoyl-containing protein [Bryobacterales bacterium]|nr:biotin/lipoyl-containing protein [Bryobacterales bacterium]
MKLTTTVDGVEQTLELSGARATPSTVSFVLDSEAGQADIVPTGAAAYSIVHDGLSYEVNVHDDGDGVFQVQVNGYAHEVEVRDARRWIRGGGAAAAAGPRKIKAPMPGRVVKLLVQAGDEVEAGQGVIVVEAMKMQNEMKAPKAGKVGMVEVAVGDPVAAGQTLLSIE